MKTKTNNSSGYYKLAALLPLCVIFLANPTVRLVDILPDFIACFTVAAILKHAADRAPYFAETREGFIKLGIVSLAKLPAFIVENSVRAGNVSDFDITVLLTFTFSVIEGILLLGIIKDLFSALFYLGERSDMHSVIRPFPVSKRQGSRLMSPEGLRTLSVFAVLFRLAAGTLPEFLLLTRTSDTGSHVLNIRVFYPYAVVLAVALSLTVGIIFAKRWCAYIRTIRTEGGFEASVEGLVDPSALPELEKKLKLSRLSLSLNLVILASAFIFVLRFDSLAGVNLVPSFATGLFIAVAALRISRSRVGVLCASFGIAFGICALIAQLTEFNFLNEYTLEMLARNEDVAAKYVPVVISHGVSLIPFALMSVLSGILLYKVGCESTLKTADETPGVYLLGRRRALAVRCFGWVILGIAATVCRFLDVYFNLYSDITIVSREDGIGGMDFGNVTYSLVPWFGTLVFALTVLYVGYTVYLTSRIKEDAELYEG